MLIISSYAKSQNVFLEDTIRSCKVDSLLLYVSDGYDSYIWNTGSTSFYSWVSSSGDYWVNIIGGDTLNITDQTYVDIVNANIVQSDTSIICGDTIILTGSSGLYDYLWLPMEESTQSITVYPRDTTYIYTEISDPDNNESFCLDSIKISVEPIMFLDTLIQSKMGCPGQEPPIAEASIVVSGGYPPYDYEWSQGIPLFEDPSYAIALSDGDLNIDVIDSIGCLLHQYYEVEAYDLPEIILSSDPDSVAYIQNPSVTFTFENPLYDSLEVDTFQLTSWTWDFGDDVTAANSYSPTHIYTVDGTYKVVFDYTTYYGCNAEDSIIVEIKPVKLKVTSVITPNGDGKNDFFEIIEDDEGTSDGGEEESTFKLSTNGSDVINLNDYYISNTLIIFNRWGKKVYEVDNYKNDWDADDLIDGIYFYILQCVGQTKEEVYKGSVTILGKEY